MPAAGRLCTKVEPITTEQYPTPARRPAASAMSCEKLQRMFGFQLPGWEPALDLVMEDMPECRA
jgi:dTDP-4-dehydrorhamnose reductase